MMTEFFAAAGRWDASPAFIVLVGLTGILLWHLIPARQVTTRLIVQIVIFVTMTAILLAGDVVPYEPSRAAGISGEAILVGAAKLLWWLHLAWALIGFVRIYLVIERKPREARLLQDLVVGAVYVGMLLSVLAFVFDAPIGTLVATSGVFAIILGLALQNTLSDVFSGIALSLGQPYGLGDFIVLSDGTEGRVVETNWRSTHLLTLAHNIVALPNSVLAKLGLTNITRPDEDHGLSVRVRLVPTQMPHAILEVVQSALLSCDSIVQSPPPSAVIRSLDAAAIEVELMFRVGNVDSRNRAKNDIFDLVYRHCRSSGLSLALPPSAILAAAPPLREATGGGHVGVIDLIRATPLFAALTEQERATLAATTTIRVYRSGDIIVRRGERLASLMIIRTGVIVRQIGDGDDHRQELGHLSPGDFFGETGLLAGIGEMATLRAVSPVEVCEIDHDSFASLLRERPGVAEDLAAILSARVTPSGPGAPPAEQHPHSKLTLLRAIERVFSTSVFRRA
jgi:small-conductance mechanosensitive channel